METTRRTATRSFGARLGRLSTTTWWIVAMVLSVAIAIFSYRYLPRIGPLGPNILANPFANPWLDLHVGGAATALLVGSFQFITPLRERVAGAHRWIGRVYVVSCLVGGVGGFVIALGSAAGPIATVAFGSLAVIWIWVNVQGWRTALARRFVEHRRWMIRSWALTLAAVTLRIYMLALPFPGLSVLDGYRAIAFLCWVPNLIIAEVYLRGMLSRRSLVGAEA